MYRIQYSLTLSVLFLLEAACGGWSQSPQPSAAPSAAVGAADAPTAPIVDGNYRLAVQDVVKVTVFQEDDLTTSARVAEDGTIQLPLIGTVQIGGKTAHEASDLIAFLLNKDYLVNPQVAISVTDFAKRRFTVLGQVKSPGTYEIPANESLDVIEAIGLAGGYTRSANIARITLKRNAEDGDRVYRLNGKEMAHDSNTQSFKVLPGDTITVEESFF